MTNGKNTFMVAMLLSLFITSCILENGDKKSEDKGSKKIKEMSDQTSVLKIEAKLERENLYRGERPCMALVIVSNIGKEPLLINKRLAVGYRNSDSRELFVEVHRKGTEEIVSIENQDYNRSPASSQDYHVLQAGEFITSSFDFCEWYNIPLDVNGELEMVVFYQADETNHEKPEAVLKGIFASEPIPFMIID